MAKARSRLSRRVLLSAAIPLILACATLIGLTVGGPAARDHAATAPLANTFLHWRPVTTFHNGTRDTELAFRDVTAWSRGFLAVGGSADMAGHAAVYESPDGLHWTELSPPGLTDAMRITAYGPTAYLLGADQLTMTGDTDPKALEVWSSADGTTWRQLTTQDPVVLPPQTPVLGFTASRAGVVLVASYLGDPILSGVIWESSADGAHWTPLRELPGEYPDSGTGGGVLAAAPDGGFVFTGFELGRTRRPPDSSSEDDFNVARFLTSADGLHWSDQSAVFSDAHVLRAFAAGDNGTAACGNVVTPLDSPERGNDMANGALTCWYRKNNSSTWTPARPPPGLLPDAGVAPLGDQQILAITAAGPGFIAVGGSGSPAGGVGAIWVSPNGTTWQKVPTTASGAAPFEAGLTGVAVYQDTAIAYAAAKTISYGDPIGSGYLISAPGRPATATLTITAAPSATTSRPAAGSPTTPVRSAALLRWSIS